MKTYFTYLTIIIILLITSACTSSSYVKRSEHGSLYSPSMGKDMSYSVYTPPNWQASESLPVMVLLHGARDNHETFDRYAVGSILDEQMNAGMVPRVIIVSPDGELGFWENWHDGSKLYRDWVVKDLMPHISRRYSTLPCPEHCFVSGISMGGHGALRFAYYEPDTFASTAAISAPIISRLHPGKPSIGRTLLQWLIPTKRIWGDIDNDSSHVPKDLDPYISWVNKAELVDMPLLLTWGKHEGESISRANQKFQQHLAENGKAHAWFIYDGAHKWVDWRQIMGTVINFHFSSSKSEKNKAIREQNTLPMINYVPAK